MTAEHAVADAPRRPSLTSLTGLRFIAAMAVVVSHFTAAGLLSGGAPIFEFLDGGRTAVSLFFVLSGFVLAYNYPGLTGGRARWNFYVARIARIYPTVVLGVAVGAIGVVYAWSRPDLLLQWYALPSPDLAEALAALGAQLTTSTGWFPFAAINQPWNGPAWSIACEVFFYAMFPLLIIGFRRCSRRAALGMAAGVWVTQGLLILALDAWLPANRSGFLITQFPVTHLGEFVLGIAAWRWWSGRAINRGVRAVELVAVIAALVALSLLKPLSPQFWLMSPLFAALVVLLAARGPARSVLALPVMQILGEASYSLYLVHLPLVHVWEIIGVQPGVGGWVALAVTVLISIGVFRWYEAPLRRAIRRTLSATRPSPAVDPRPARR